MSASLRWSPLLLLGISALAWSNGGPMAWNDPAGAGDGAPQVQSSVVLVSEDLSIRLSPDAGSYEVEARYVLSNPKAATTVRYGVPVTWGLMGEGEPEAAAVQKAGDTVSIEIGGVRQGCKVERAGGESPLLIGVPEELRVESLPVGAWCVTDLKIPKGASVPLVLRYRANTSFVDGETSKSAIPGWAPKDIVYPLFPAAGWAGTPKLNVKVDLGAWAEDGKVLHPAGFKREGTVWTYSNAKADLSVLGTVVARVEQRDAQRFQFALGVNGSQGPYSVKLTATASSTLTGGTYGAANLLDGKAETAWCEGVEGDGSKQWVELRAAPGTKLPDYCGLEGLILVPGYSKTQAVYDNNGRVRTMTVGACGGAGPTTPEDLAPAQRYNRSASVIDFYDGAPAGRQSLGDTLKKDPANFCVRLTISDVVPGAKYHDTCISEIGALINCG